jgi:hypothetical protein
VAFARSFGNAFVICVKTCQRSSATSTWISVGRVRLSAQFFCRLFFTDKLVLAMDGLYQETMEVMRAGSLRKRGTHISDEFHFRCHLAHFHLLYAWFLCADFSGNLSGLTVLSNLVSDRYVCVWQTRIGYSLSPTEDIICDFIEINDVEQCVAVDSSNKDEQVKCDFIVQVKTGVLQRDFPMQYM